MKLFSHRHSIRLRKFDYSNAGWYFATICTQNRECLFGEIIDGKMVLNNSGIMIEKFWNKIPIRFNTAELNIFQIMPNHIHVIIVIVGAGFSRPKPILGQIIGYFKYQTTKYINNLIKGSEDPTPTKKHKFKQIFQRNYYEHIIRHEFELQRIRQYIRDNPKNWDVDENNLQTIGGEI